MTKVNAKRERLMNALDVIAAERRKMVKQKQANVADCQQALERWDKLSCHYGLRQLGVTLRRNLKMAEKELTWIQGFEVDLWIFERGGKFAEEAYQPRRLKSFKPYRPEMKLAV